ncbi:MAG TPA: neocarzinostatin apoprotein domain-containing protein [Acidimicrobiales bacterium]|nr:neocarzinostatin apoprotein domain-containing protein [Acidimicrobiales bacterium]
MDGQQVEVSGSGLTPNVNGVLVECNSAPGQPTVEDHGILLPISCSNPFAPEPYTASDVVTTSETGTFQATFVVHTGVVGPPAREPDSAGGDSATDAANYPCPPSPDQQESGDVCWVAYDDGANDAAHANVDFGSPSTLTPSVLLQSGGMEGGDTVRVLASGFAPDSPTLIEECNLTPGEPSQPYGPGPAIGCTQPLDLTPPGLLVLTDSTGALTTDVTLAEGNIGGLAGSVAYPCPPTPANAARGGSCDIFVEDAGSHQAHAYLGLDGPVPVPSLSVSPTTGLFNGQQVTVTGSGFSPANSATLFECNETPGEPTADINGVQLPVGCSNPLGVGGPFQSGFAVTGPDGTLGTKFVVTTGVLGPPEMTVDDSSGLDSAGGEIASDTTKYPCPATPAQQAAGATCAITFVDNSNETVSVPIAFGAPRTFDPSIQVLAVLGNIDISNLAGGTEVVVTGSGFTPNSPAIIFECNFTPSPAVPTAVLQGDCMGVQEAAQLTTDPAGEVTGNAVIGTFPGPGLPAIVVRDAAGDQAQAPIGLSGSP